MRIIQSFNILRTFCYLLGKHCMVITLQSKQTQQIKRWPALMSACISPICASFWKWNNVLCGKFNCSYDLASKDCKISNKSYTSIHVGPEEFLNMWWIKPWHSESVGFRVSQNFLLVLAWQLTHWSPWANWLTSLSLHFHKCKAWIITRTYNTLPRLGYFE